MLNLSKKVSIIMGVRNSGTRFIEAVKSIENQTYTNWEFIICDDGSTDDTYNNLIKYTSNNGKFIIIKNSENLGLAATLNHCLQYCKGEYIARMDDDDYSYPQRFAEQVMLLEKNPDVAFVSSNADIYDGKEIVSQRILIEKPTKRNLVYGSQFIHPATMFRAEVLKSVGGYRVCKDTIRGQDYDLFMRLYGKGFRGQNIVDPVFRYTEDKANLKRRTFKARIGEMKIRIHGYKEMGVLYWAFPFVFKPFIAWMFSKIKKK